MEQTTTRPKITLRQLVKPAQLDSVLAKLAEKPAQPHQIAPGSTNGPSARSNPPQGQETPQKPATLMEQLKAELGVAFVPVPLAVGTAKKVSPAARRLIGKLVKRDAYQRALAADGSVRYHLDGSVAGPVLDQHRQHARAAVGTPPDEGTTQGEKK